MAACTHAHRRSPQVITSLLITCLALFNSDSLQSFLFVSPPFLSASVSLCLARLPSFFSPHFTILFHSVVFFHFLPSLRPLPPLHCLLLPYSLSSPKPLRLPPSLTSPDSRGQFSLDRVTLCVSACYSCHFAMDRVCPASVSLRHAGHLADIPLTLGRYCPCHTRLFTKLLPCMSSFSLLHCQASVRFKL